MTFAEARTIIGWSYHEIGRRLGCDDHLPRRWELGKAAIPPDVAAWLLDLATAVSRHPAPIGWRVRPAQSRRPSLAP